MTSATRPREPVDGEGSPNLGQMRVGAGATSRHATVARTDRRMSRLRPGGGTPTPEDIRRGHRATRAASLERPPRSRGGRSDPADLRCACAEGTRLTVIEVQCCNPNAAGRHGMEARAVGHRLLSGVRLLGHGPPDSNHTGRFRSMFSADVVKDGSSSSPSQPVARLCGARHDDSLVTTRLQVVEKSVTP